MSDILADRILAIADLTDDSDWKDVRRRACRTHDGRPAVMRLPWLDPRRTRSLVAAAIVVAAVAAAPALAFSTTVRELVGLQTSSPRGPVFVATVTGVVLHGPNRAGTLVTVTFTVGEPGKPPGTGVPQGSTFLVLVTHTSQMAPAQGEHGHYQARTRLGPGGFTGIQIGGYMPSKGGKVLNGVSGFRQQSLPRLINRCGSAACA